MLKNKTILLGVTGGIAAYKACEIVSGLKKLGADVWVVMTNEATKLVSPLTFRTLSQNPVIVDLFADGLSSMPVPHIALADKADIFLIAPCTANVIGKMANGIADDPLTTMVMASPKLKLIAPAMNNNMWNNQAMQQNLNILKQMNFAFIGPEVGQLACGTNDIGRMSEPKDIIAKVIECLHIKQDLAGQNFLITAGGTREAIDPVRYITNHSSGKMGYAIARAARERGANVTLISAPTSLTAPMDISPVNVVSAQEMLEAVMDYQSKAQTIVMAAAVADYRPVAANFSSPSQNGGLKTSSTKKIKKASLALQLQLEPTADILKAINHDKKRKDKKLVGFALETENMIANARKKLKEKDLDLIVANDTSTFDADSIKFSLIDKKGSISNYPRQPKDQAAHVILDRVS